MLRRFNAAHMIRLQALQKTFLGRVAVHPLTLEVPAGEIFGLLGHNGAGKSTTFGMLLGQVHPDAGEAFIGGASVQRDRATALGQVGAIFEAPVFYDYLSGWQNLEIFTTYSRPVTRQAMQEAVEAVGLSGRIHAKVRTYSHGMRQRLGLAQALLPEPKVLLLDEPTEGLDPEGIHEMRHFVQRLNREQGMTVLFSSHLLAEVQLMCHQVAIMHRGRLIFTGPWQQLQERGGKFRLEVDDTVRAVPVCQSHGANLIGTELTLPETVDVADVVAALVGAGLRVRAVEPLRQDLEGLYLKLVQQQNTAV